MCLIVTEGQGLAQVEVKIKASRFGMAVSLDIDRSNRNHAFDNTIALAFRLHFNAKHRHSTVEANGTLARKSRNCPEL